MARGDQGQARKKVRAAQAEFQRELEVAREARRRAFAEAQEEGLSLRAIGEEVDLHHTRVGQIIRDE